MGWIITKATETTLVIADDTSTTPIGKISDVIITFGSVQIPVDMEVVETNTYGALLGVDYMVKSKINLNAEEQEMTIKAKGINEVVPLGLCKSIHIGNITQRRTLTAAIVYILESWIERLETIETITRKEAKE